MFGNNGNNNNNDVTGNLLDLISIMLGYENLIENRQQSEENNVEKQNRIQSDSLLKDLHEQFSKQNKILEHQNNLLNEILFILKGENKNDKFKM